MRKTRAPTKYPLPSERIPFETHFEVLRRFATVTGNGREAVTAQAVEGNGLRQQSAQLNTGFMVALGLLSEEERGKFKPTPDALTFLVTKSASEDRARPILRALVDRAWFAETAKILLASKPVVTEQELCQELAITAATDAAKKGGALEVLVDYLVYSGLVRRTEQGLVLGADVVATVSPPHPTMSVSPQPVQTPRIILQAPQVIPAPPVMSSPPSVTFGFGIGPVPQSLLAWRTIQTDDFLVRLRPDLSVIADLRDHLDLLERKLKRAPPADASSEKGAGQ